MGYDFRNSLKIYVTLFYPTSVCASIRLCELFLYSRGHARERERKRVIRLQEQWVLYAKRMLLMLFNQTTSCISNEYIVYSVYSVECTFNNKKAHKYEHS